MGVGGGPSGIGHCLQEFKAPPPHPIKEKLNTRVVATNGKNMKREESPS